MERLAVKSKSMQNTHIIFVYLEQRVLCVFDRNIVQYTVRSTKNLRLKETYRLSCTSSRWRINTVLWLRAFIFSVHQWHSMGWIYGGQQTSSDTDTFIAKHICFPFQVTGKEIHIFFYLFALVVCENKSRKCAPAAVKRHDWTRSDEFIFIRETYY